MNYKYINFIMVSGETVTVRDGYMFDDDSQFVTVTSGRNEWRVNMDQVRYMKISKDGEE